MVSVHVVESCRVETDGSVVSNSVALTMRCSSSARPRVGLLSAAHTVPAVGSLSVPSAQLEALQSGPTLSIQF